MYIGPRIEKRALQTKQSISEKEWRLPHWFGPGRFNISAAGGGYASASIRAPCVRGCRACFDGVDGREEPQTEQAASCYWIPRLSELQ
jgi:hypothetical protein